MDWDTEWLRKMEKILKCYRTTGNEPGMLFRRVTFSQKKYFLDFIIEIFMICGSILSRKI